MISLNAILPGFTHWVETNSSATPWTRQKAEHLARKALFAATPTMVDTLYNAWTANAAVNLLFPSTDWPDRSQYNSELATITSATWFDISNSSWMYKYYVMKKYRDPYEAKVKYFVMFEDIFAVNTVYQSIYFSDIENTHNLIYANMFGNYKNLIKKIVYNNWQAWDYTMWKFLDLFNQQDKNNPNENYARELLQLFLMLEHKPWEWVDTTWAVRNYTEADVAALARIITWLEADNTTHAVTFNSAKHYTWVVEFLTWNLKSWDSFAFYNNLSWTINAQTILNPINWNNWLTDNIIDYIFSKRENEISYFLAYRLLKYYVKDTPTQTEIETLASQIRWYNFDMYQSVKYLLASDIMYSDEAMNTVYYKNPLELSIWTLKLLHYKNPNVIDPFATDTSLLTNLEWTPYFAWSIFGRDWFDSNNKFFNAYNHNQWVNFASRLAYSSNSSWYSLSDLIPTTRITESSNSLYIFTTWANTYSWNIFLSNISLNLSWTVPWLSNISVANNNSQLLQEKEQAIATTEIESNSWVTKDVQIQEISSTWNIEISWWNQITDNSLSTWEIFINSWDILDTTWENIQLIENLSWDLQGSWEITTWVQQEQVIQTTQTITEKNINLDSTQLESTASISNWTVTLPSFSITTNQWATITIWSWMIDMVNFKLHIFSWNLNYQSNNYPILSWMSDIANGSSLIRDINPDEMITQLEDYLYLWRRLPDSVKSEIKNFLLKDENWNTRIFKPNDNTYKNNVIKWVIAIMLVQPEFVLNMWYDKQSQESNWWSSLLPNSNSKLVLVELYGWYDWLHAIFPKNQYDVYSGKRAWLAVSQNDAIDLWDYYLNPAYSWFKQFYDSWNLRIVNRVWTPAHSRWHDTAAIKVTSYASSEVYGTPWLIWHMIENEVDATKNVVLWSNTPNIYSKWNYLNIGWNSAQYVNYGSLNTNQKNQQLNTIRNILNTRTYPGTTQWLFKWSSTIDNVATTSKNAWWPASAWYNLSQRFTFLKSLIDNNLWVTYYVPWWWGYDTHWDQVTASTWDYDLTNRTSDLTKDIVNFFNQVKDNKDVTIIVFSEFGRTLKTNWSIWTDHWEGGWYFILSSNNNFLSSVPQKIIWNIDLAKEKDDWFGVWVDYRAIYTKLFSSLYNVNFSNYLWQNFELNDYLNTTNPNPVLVRHEFKANWANNAYMDLKFKVEDKNFIFDEASYLTFKYWTNSGNLSTFSRWTLDNYAKQTDWSYKINISVPKNTQYYYSLIVRDNQFNEYILTWNFKTPNVLANNISTISITWDNVLMKYNNISVTWNTDIQDITLYNAWTWVNSFTITWNDWIKLTVWSWQTLITSIFSQTWTDIWNWWFVLPKEVNKTEFLSEDANLNWSDLSWLNISKIIKVWADKLWVWMQLNKNVVIWVPVSNLSSWTYAVITSEDGINWTWIQNSNTTLWNDWYLSFATDKFSYFAIVQVDWISCWLNISPKKIFVWDNAKLSWISSWATSRIIDNWIWNISSSWIQTITPTNTWTVTYNFDISNWFVSTRCSDTITILQRNINTWTWTIVNASWTYITWNNDLKTLFSGLNMSWTINNVNRVNFSWNLLNFINEHIVDQTWNQIATINIPTWANIYIPETSNWIFQKNYITWLVEQTVWNKIYRLKWAIKVWTNTPAILDNYATIVLSWIANESIKFAYRQYDTDNWTEYNFSWANCEPVFPWICWYKSWNDVVIKTYHFTQFAAITEETVTENNNWWGSSWWSWGWSSSWGGWWWVSVWFYTLNNNQKAIQDSKAEISIDVLSKLKAKYTNQSDYQKIVRDLYKLISQNKAKYWFLINIFEQEISTFKEESIIIPTPKNDTKVEENTNNTQITENMNLIHKTPNGKIYKVYKYNNYYTFDWISPLRFSTIYQLKEYLDKNNWITKKIQINETNIIKENSIDFSKSKPIVHIAPNWNMYIIKENNWKYAFVKKQWYSKIFNSKKEIINYINLNNKK